MPTCPKCEQELSPERSLDLCPRCAISFALFDNAPPQEASASAISSGTIFGDYELIEEIARGGMGVVYKARQRSLNRIVALKMILAGQFATKEFIRRFRVEAGSAAALQHPNIVAIHEVGVHGGHHFFSMDYVPGQNLAELVGNRPLAPKSAARYLQQIADAVHYAHQQGVLHRDLKPQNILIDSATDQPRITDFGLARRLEGDSSVTITGQVLGSPHFMPPEQAGGRRGTVGRHSDVYSLGGILFFILTARPPFQGDSIEETLHNVLNTEAISPRLLNPSVPRDLETICLKCLERDSKTRYSTAQEMADELDRFLQGKPIRARPISQSEKILRWCRRKPAIATLTIALAILLLGFAIGGPISAARINSARRAAELNLYVADMNLAGQALENHNLRRARELLEKHSPHALSAVAGSVPHERSAQADLRGWEWRYLSGQCHGDELTTLARGSAQVSTVCFSPDGTLLFAAIDDGTIRVWDFPSRRELAPFQTFTGNFGRHPFSRHHAVAVSPDGRLLAAGGPNKDIQLWDIRSRKKLPALIGHTDTIRDLHFAPDSLTLASASRDGTIRLWDTRTNSLREIASLKHGREALRAVFSPDGRMLATSGMERYVRFWGLSTGAMPCELPPPIEGSGWVFALAFSPDGKFLATSSNGGSLVPLWDTVSHTLAATLPGELNLTEDLAFSTDGSKIASGGEDFNITVWDRTDPRNQLTLQGHKGEVYSVAFSRDGNILVSGSTDGTVKLWDVSSFDRKQTTWQFRDFIGQVVFSADGKYLAGISNGDRDQLKLWDVAANHEIATTNLEPTSGAASVSFSEDSKTLAVCTEHQRALLKVPSLQILTNLPASTIAFSKKGNFLILIRDRQVIRRDLASGSEMVLGALPGDNFMRIAVSPDGRKAAIALRDQAPLITIWDTLNAAPPVFLRGHAQYLIISVAFSPNSELLASAGMDGSVGVWNVREGRKIALF
jgi:WD40 repeat protein/serine/threonine protein kinase